ncbi:mechanosensitive ion channel family protein [Uliginosibacterium paludis]|uniref:Mechanosensitive ion channel domain-containing protein n=1 Tax=Uliginosibacterium paludis TaxID=1615952 RepID=A0ABV2CQ81_9RHOO
MDFLDDVIALLSHPATLREMGTLFVLLGSAWLIAGWLKPKPGVITKLRGLRSVAFPILGILSVGAFQIYAVNTHWRLHFAPTIVSLLWAMIGLRIVRFVLQRAFPRAHWVQTFGRAAATVVWTLLALDLFNVLPEIIDWLNGFVIPMGKNHITLWEIMQGFGSVAGSLLVALWLGGLIESRLLAMKGVDSSVQVVLSRVAQAVLILMAVLIGAELVGLDLTALSVFGGALGVGLGLGMQKIASSYVSGFIILLDRSIKIGNLIQVGNDRGEVLNITTRYTVLRSLAGAHFIVPNDTLVGSTVQNDSFVTPNTRVAVQVQVAYGTDVEAVLPMLQEIGALPERVLKDPAPMAYLVSFDDSGMTLELGVWIADPGNGTMGLKSDLNRAILKRFREAAVEIPFPQREIRLLGTQIADS